MTGASTYRTSVCPACGNRVSSTSRFCEEPSCGVFLGWDEQAPAEAEVPEAGARDPFTARLSAERVEVGPGETVSVDVVVHNHGPVVEQYDFALTGAATGYGRVDPAELTVYPDGESTAQLTFAPPAVAAPPVGDTPYHLTVTGTESRSTVRLPGVVCVGACGGVEARILPQSSRGRWPAFSVEASVTNESNASSSVAVAADDPDRRIRWRQPPAPAVLPSGASAGYPVHGRAPVRWWGPEVSYPFAVHVTSSLVDTPVVGRPDERTLPGTRVQAALVPKWLPIAAVLALVVAVVAMTLLAQPEAVGEVRVPAVAGDTAQEARAAIEDAGLEADLEEEASATVPDGTVVRTQPDAGTPLEPGSEVKVVVSTGPPAATTTTVPDLTEQPAEEAAALLEAEDLELGPTREEPSETVEAGLVLRTIPEAGAEVDVGASVTVVVSSGPEQPPSVPVPGAVGMAVDQATGAVVDAGLVLGAVTYEPSETAPEGTVIASDPAAGEPVAPGTSVDLVVSSGPEDQPPPSGLPEVLVGSWAGGEGDSVEFALTLGADGSFELRNDSAGTYVAGTATATEDTMTWDVPGEPPRTMEWYVDGVDMLHLLEDTETTWIRAD